ncbi:LysR family transcriptional regulator [Mycoavidus sp. B2-EB]|uniref:LysR family transcriptional regulator n=1 Tax=Mycoavidus sp. B2-EB TaxID=2651972 RepID=UPI0016247A58|nr:LysR family transcriptional regulator [Mycoavidus sp. B2-EB]BBO59428.1 LysR family transcriptional regulator [Mycoavidus sp. B2-EB]
MIPEINQRRLRYFYEVCTCGKIREAADNLNMDSSVITRQIRLLEEEIGFKLFERRPRGVVPTEAAELLLKYYRGNCDLKENLERGLHELRNMHQGNIHLAIHPTFVGALISVFNNFRAQYPDIHLHIEENFETNKIINQILEDISHIGILCVYQDSPHINYFARVPLPLYMLVNKKHPLANKHKVTFAEAIRYPLSLPATGALRQMVQSVAKTEKIELQPPVFISNSTTARKRFACTDAGAVFMSAFSAFEEIKSGELVALEIDHPSFQAASLALIVRRGKPLLPPLHQLLRLISAHLPIFARHPLAENSHLTTISEAPYE